MSDRERFEVHFDDGQVKVAADLRSARTIAGQRPEHDAEVWAVAPKRDLGIGTRVDCIVRNHDPRSH